MHQARYDRTTHLPSLLPLWPQELEIHNAAEHAALLHKLQKALRAERRRGLAGHWCYNLMRHANLLAAYRAEKRLYEKLWA